MGRSGQSLLAMGLAGLGWSNVPMVKLLPGSREAASRSFCVA